MNDYRVRLIACIEGAHTDLDLATNALAANHVLNRLDDFWQAHPAAFLMFAADLGFLVDDGGVLRPVADRVTLPEVAS